MLVPLLLGLVFGGVAAVAARSRGRNGVGWFVAGMLIGPFALVVALLPLVARQGVTAACPRCAEIVPQDARLCRYCGEPLELSRPPTWDAPPPPRRAARPDLGFRD